VEEGLKGPALLRQFALFSLALFLKELNKCSLKKSLQPSGCESYGNTAKYFQRFLPDFYSRMRGTVRNGFFIYLKALCYM